MKAREGLAGWRRGRDWVGEGDWLDKDITVLVVP